MVSAGMVGAEVGLGGSHHRDEPWLGAPGVFSCPGGAQCQWAEPVSAAEVWEHRGTLHGGPLDTLGLLQLCRLGPQHEGFGGTRLPAKAGGVGMLTPPNPGIREIQAEPGAK